MCDANIADEMIQDFELHFKACILHMHTEAMNCCCFIAPCQKFSLEAIPKCFNLFTDETSKYRSKK